MGQKLGQRSLTHRVTWLKSAVSECRLQAAGGGGFHQIPFAELTATKFARDASFAQNQDPVTDGNQFGKFAGSQDDCQAVVTQCVNQSIDLGLGADIDPSRGIIEQQQFRPGSQRARDNTLLLIPSTEAGDGSGGAGGFNLE